MVCKHTIFGWPRKYQYSLQCIEIRYSFGARCIRAIFSPAKALQTVPTASPIAHVTLSEVSRPAVRRRADPRSLEAATQKMLRLQHPLTGLGWWPLPRSPRWSADCAIVVPRTEHASPRPLAMATVSGRSPERCRRTESGRHNAPRGGQLQHSRGRTRDHGTPPAMQSCFGSASDAMLGAICRTTVDAPLCAAH